VLAEQLSETSLLAAAPPTCTYNIIVTHTHTHLVITTALLTDRITDDTQTSISSSLS